MINFLKVTCGNSLNELTDISSIHSAVIGIMEKNVKLTLANSFKVLYNDLLVHVPRNHEVMLWFIIITYY